MWKHFSRNTESFLQKQNLQGTWDDSAPSYIRKKRSPTLVDVRLSVFAGLLFIEKHFLIIIIFSCY